LLSNSACCCLWILLGFSQMVKFVFGQDTTGLIEAGFSLCSHSLGGDGTRLCDSFSGSGLQVRTHLGKSPYILNTGKGFSLIHTDWWIEHFVRSLLINGSKGAKVMALDLFVEDFLFQRSEKVSAPSREDIWDMANKDPCVQEAVEYFLKRLSWDVIQHANALVLTNRCLPVHFCAAFTRPYDDIKTLYLERFGCQPKPRAFYQRRPRGSFQLTRGEYVNPDFLAAIMTDHKRSSLA